MGDKWEYLQFKPLVEQDLSLIDQLNILGLDHWELVLKNGSSYYLKRILKIDHLNQPFTPKQFQFIQKQGIES